MNIDKPSLHALAETFQRAFPDLVSFEAPSDDYVQLERAYKDELRAQFNELFGSLVANSGTGAEWFEALLALLTVKLDSVGTPQNLVSWRIVGALKALSEDQKSAAGEAVQRLLTRAGDPWSRYGDFADAFRSAMSTDGKLATPAHARDIGTLLLALQDPHSACPVRYDVFDKASRSLLGRSLFETGQSASAELRACLAFANALFVGLRDDEGLAPRDLLDVQGFLWVVFKYPEESVTYGELFRRALDLFATASRSEPYGEKPDLWAAMEAIRERLAKEPAIASKPDLLVRWTLGRGNWAKVPWIAILDRRLTTTTQEGVYIVLLVSEDLSRVFLTLNQGMTKLVDEHGQPAAIRAMAAQAAGLRTQIADLEQTGFALDSDIDLKTKSWRPKMYEYGTVAHIDYDVNAFPDDDEFARGLEQLVESYDQIAANQSEPKRPGWFMGAKWGDEDMTNAFVEEGVWKNGYDDGPTLDEVRQVQVGDRIAIKASFTQEHGLPFGYTGKASVMRIKAVGVVTGNAGDGRTLEVAWDHDHAPRDWYFYTNRETVWPVQPGSGELADRLLAFAFDGEAQDYDWFLRQPYWRERAGVVEAGEEADAYTVEDALQGLFMDRGEFERILSVWRGKKNLVLQGAPGVGKSFVARRLAYALMGFKDEARVANVQFHQSYGYEDFIQGYRPTESGGFKLRDGLFHRVCESARKDPDRPHVFIIDEINRGNLSKIFGELMLLIETDKRTDKWALQLAYADETAPPFYVPNNLYLLGMMNTADRSLSLVDYALRRRFAFIGLEPGFGSDGFGPHLRAQGVSEVIVRKVVSGMTALNEAIASDTTNLGPGFQIGHSFFTPIRPVASDEDWFQTVVETEIRPLLEEYWFDDPAKAAEWRERLLNA